MQYVIIIINTKISRNKIVSKLLLQPHKQLRHGKMNSVKDQRLTALLNPHSNLAGQAGNTSRIGTFYTSIPQTRMHKPRPLILMSNSGRSRRKLAEYMKQIHM